MTTFDSKRSLRSQLGRWSAELLFRDVPKAKEVWSLFEKWLAAYSNSDLKEVMKIFDKDVQFSFQGSKDQRYPELELSYVEDFKSRKPETAWVLMVDEVYADGRLALVRAVWELRVKCEDGQTEIKARNRSMDVFARRR